MASLQAVPTLMREVMPNRSTKPIAAMTCLSALPYLPTSIICLHRYYIQSAISCLLTVTVMFVSKCNEVLYELNQQWRQQPADCRCLCDNVEMHISLWVVNKNFILFYLFIYLFIILFLLSSVTALFKLLACLDSYPYH